MSTTRYRPAAVITAALVAGALGLAGRAAHATPVYAQKEGKTCIYCHTGPVGNATNSNYRGIFYKKNGHTFAGFDDAAEAKKAGVEVGPEATPPHKTYSPPGAKP